MVTPAHACSYVFIVLTPAQHNLVGDNHLRKSYKIHIYLLYHNITPLWHTNTEWGGWCACVFSYWCKHGDWLTTTWSRQEAHQGSLHLQSCITAIRVVREVAYRANVTGGIASAVSSLSDLPKDLKSMVNGRTSLYIGRISTQKNGSCVFNARKRLYRRCSWSCDEQCLKCWSPTETRYSSSPLPTVQGMYPQESALCTALERHKSIQAQIQTENVKLQLWYIQ